MKPSGSIQKRVSTERNFLRLLSGVLFSSAWLLKSPGPTWVLELIGHGTEGRHLLLLWGVDHHHHGAQHAQQTTDLPVHIQTLVQKVRRENSAARKSTFQYPERSQSVTFGLLAMTCAIIFRCGGEGGWVFHTHLRTDRPLHRTLILGGNDCFCGYNKHNWVQTHAGNGAVEINVTCLWH